MKLSIPVVISAGTVCACGALFVLGAFAKGNTNTVALNTTPKGVTVVHAIHSEFREERRFIGTIDAWQEASVGPQMVSAYVDTVLVRPGSSVKKGDVLATLDCRQAASGNSAIAAQARALEAKQRAISGETLRVQGLVERGYVSDNEIDQRVAQTASGEAQLEALRAQLASKSLEVNDCVLKAPFTGEVSSRLVDAGAFARPGMSLVSVVDRSVVRLVGYAPETDFDAIGPGTDADVELVATGLHLRGKIARRAPQADPKSRNVRFEIDFDNADRKIPTGTTAIVRVRSAAAQPATEIPLTAATVRGGKATVFLITADKAVQQTFKVIGERHGSLFLEPSLASGTSVVVEGRSQLRANDVVVAKLDAFEPVSP